jgi:hypothetical protein
LPGLFGDLKPYRPAGLLLADRRSLNGVSVRGNILDFETDDIATTQFAVDGKIEQRQVALAVRHLKFGAYRPDVFWPERRLRPGQLALVPRGTLRHNWGWIFALFTPVAHLVLQGAGSDKNYLLPTMGHFRPHLFLSS